MNAREVIADELRRLGSFMPDEETDNILFRLNIRGFTIMSKEDVEAVREKALEIVAAKREEAENFLRGVQMAGNDNWSAKGAIAACNDIEKAIRSLKSKEGKVDS